MSIDPARLHDRPVVIGAGIAGLVTALRLAPQPVVLLSKGALGAESSSVWAQGGLAASLGADDDPARHRDDTLAAGDGLCDPDVVETITRAAPATVDALLRHGVRFDRMASGALALGLEAAHSRHRIVHAAGDGTGREIVRALIEATLRTPSITVLEGHAALRLVIDDGAVVGVDVAGSTGPLTLATRKAVVATGGIGGLFGRTTNPDGSTGQGLALAARAGAVLADLEFIQFHPTALAGPASPAPLVSEAVRGEGAVLVDETGRRFLADEPGAELAPRDVVTRGVWRHLSQGHRVFLDARSHPGERFAERFPAITAACRAAGLDPARQLIPIEPAAHYHMGGIAVDLDGRSSVPGLWACGEVACTGLHGANRLASNSLIEAAACAGWVADSVSGAVFPGAGPRRASESAQSSAGDIAPVRTALSCGVGVLRDDETLQATIQSLLPWAESSGTVADAALVGLMIAIAAWRRQESRGAHWRTDFPRRAADASRSRLRLDDALRTAREICSDRPFTTRTACP